MVKVGPYDIGTKAILSNIVWYGTVVRRNAYVASNEVTICVLQRVLMLYLT